MRAGDTVEIEPSELVAGGAALARIDGLPIFAANVYPGDGALVRILEVKKGFARAELLRLTRPGPLRRFAPCSVAGECGGCDWTSLRLDAQLAAKERILTESLRRIGKIHEHPPIAIHPSPLNYRLRSRLHRQGEAVGFYATGSHRVVPLAPECEVVGPNVARSLGPAERAVPEGDSIEVWDVDGTILAGEHELQIRVAQFTYRLSTSSFFQVNRHLLATMLRLVSGHAARVRNRDLAIDLYAGVGFFTLPLAALFTSVIAVEGSATSARCARMNVPPNAEVCETAVDAFDVPEADCILLDPPRAGTSRGVIESIAARAREMVCHLSCDPVTFARDASRLIASGWRLATLDLLDLFPNTHHVETLASFERAQ